MHKLQITRMKWQGLHSVISGKEINVVALWGGGSSYKYNDRSIYVNKWWLGYDCVKKKKAKKQTPHIRKFCSVPQLPGGFQPQVLEHWNLKLPFNTQYLHKIRHFTAAQHEIWPLLSPQCLFLIWCMAPVSWNGSGMLYKRVIRPFFLKHQAAMDNVVSDLTSKAKNVTENVTKKGKTPTAHMQEQPDSHSVRSPQHQPHVSGFGMKHCNTRSGKQTALWTCLWSCRSVMWLTSGLLVTKTWKHVLSTAKDRLNN